MKTLRRLKNDDVVEILTREEILTGEEAFEVKYLIYAFYGSIYMGKFRINETLIVKPGKNKVEGKTIYDKFSQEQYEDINDIPLLSQEDFPFYATKEVNVPKISLAKSQDKLFDIQLKLNDAKERIIIYNLAVDVKTKELYIQTKNLEEQVQRQKDLNEEYLKIANLIK